MAQRKATVKFCDACSKDVRATATIPFSFNRVEYMIDVCDKHADALQRDVMSWARLAQEIERPTNFHRPDVVREHTRRNFATSSTQPAQAACSSAAATAPAPKPVISHPALEWRLSDHAEEQLAERGPQYGFDRTDVFMCITAPELTKEDCATAKGGRQQWYRDKVQLIVDVDDKTVVTILPRSTRDFEQPKPKTAAAAAFSDSTTRKEMANASR